MLRELLLSDGPPIHIMALIRTGMGLGESSQVMGLAIQHREILPICHMLPLSPNITQLRHASENLVAGDCASQHTCWAQKNAPLTPGLNTLENASGSVSKIPGGGHFMPGGVLYTSTSGPPNIFTIVS